jgi:hypothetical protein
MALVLNGSGSITGLSAGGLPDGSVTADDIASLPAGSVIQVVQSNFTGNSSTTSTAVQTLFSASITPSSASNKVLAMVTTVGYSNGTNNSITLRLYRGTISDTQIATTMVEDGGGSYETYNFALNKLDSPSTTSAQTYTVGYNQAQTIYANMNGNNTSTLILMEIAA